MAQQNFDIRSINPEEAPPPQTLELCEYIAAKLTTKSTRSQPSQKQQKKDTELAKKDRPSPIDSSLFFGLWKLIQIVELCQFDTRILVTVPSHLQVMNKLTEALFKGLFC